MGKHRKGGCAVFMLLPVALLGVISYFAVPPVVSLIS